MRYPINDGRVTCAYGVSGKWQCGWHCGTDLVPGTGDYNIYAPVKGKVFTVGKNHASYGNYVVLKHDDGYFSRYAHLQSVAVRTGETVASGTVLGVMGSTGNASGRHLHFEVHKGASMAYPANTDPMKYVQGIDLERINDIAYELRIRGIVSDTDGLIAEVEKEPCGRLYWVCRKALNYIRETERK